MRKRFRLAAVLLFFSTASTVATSQPAIEPTAGSRTVSVSVSAAASEGLDLPDGAELVATELGSGERIRRVSLEGERIELELPSQESWRLCLEARGSWAPCRTVSATTTLADLPVWPAAALAGRLRFVGGKGDPTLLKLTIGPPPGPGPTGPLEDAVVTCEIDEEEARFTCPIPAAEIYAAVRVSGFVSRYFWGLEPEPGRATDLGSIQMQPGASLSGMVDLSIEGADGRRTVARLVPALSARVPPSVAASVEKEAKTSGVGPYGFFQFADVTPGSYMLEASHPGFATTRVGPFEVFAGKETELVAPVVLLPPIDLEVFVTPALSPLGDPWQVHVFRARDWSAGSQEVYRGAADRSGRLSVRQQSPGEFQIAITDRLGNRFHSQRVRLEPGDAGFVPIDVALVEVKGDLRLGGEAVAGLLHFGGRQGALRARMEAAEDGAFDGALGRGGEWEVEIELFDPPLETSRRVEVVPGPDGTARVEVDLADTELIGRVVDEVGRPVPGARVRADSAVELVHVHVTSDAGGEFSFRALPEGRTAVSASAQLGGSVAVSEPIQVSLEEDLPASPLELVLRSLISLSGRVLSPLGSPSPGARVAVVTSNLSVPASDLTIADADGRFQVRVPENAGLLAVTVLPPGGFLTTAVVPVREPLALQAASGGGELVTRLLGDGADAHLWVEREGVVINPMLLMEWMRGHGVQPDPEEARYPRLAEGHYRVCAVLESERRAAIGRGESWLSVVQQSTRCAEGLLTAGSSLELTIE